MKAVITLEIEIKDDIEKLYNNFIFNYDSKKDFLINQIASLNHNISIDEQMVYKNLHPSLRIQIISFMMMDISKQSLK